jgi:signal transduction histidine kinase
MSFSKSVKKFFGSQKPSTDPITPTIASNELVHINQEIYKKSAELSEKNKTLSLLQKINGLILSSIVDPKELASHVTSLLVSEGDFPHVTIFLYDKDNKQLISLSSSQNIATKNSPQTIIIPLTDKTNSIVKALATNNFIFVDNFENVFPVTSEISETSKSVFIAPLFVRNESRGAIVIALTENEKDVSEYRRDLLNRIVGSLSIGIDNALLYNQVEDSNKRLQALDKLKNEFVSVASHELRTPMTAIKSYLWMALNGKGGQLNEKQHYYVERGYNSVDRLIRLVNDMLNISRIESGRIIIELRSVDLLKLTQEVVDEVSPRAHELGVSVKIQKHEELPHVLADSDKIKEVMFNLIGNSLKFTPKGGSITISYALKNGFVETKITDTGAGIAPDDMGKLFQKFGLIEGSYVTNQTSISLGTGLGLYICRSIIDLHHGEIKAASEGRGKGSTFSFTLREFKDSDLQKFKTEATEDNKDKMDLIHVQL